MRRTSPLLLAVLALLATASPAAAAVSSSTITTPADPAYRTYDADLGPDADANRLTVTGTAVSSAPASDRVDVRCFWTDSSGALQSNPLALRVPLAADGSFTVSTDPSTLGDNPFGTGARDDAQGVQTCRLRAIPAVNAVSDLNTATLPDYAGPRVNVARFGSTTAAVRGGGNVTVDYGVGAGGLRGQAEWSSQCGTFSFRPYVNQAAFAPAMYPNWDCTRALLPPPGGDGAAQVRVDGVPAYTGSSTPVFDYDGDKTTEAPTGAAGLSVTLRRGLTSGTVTTNETTPIERCTAPTFPPTAASCPTLAPTGVQLERQTVLDDDGLQSTLTETYRSVDGAAHQVAIDAETYVVFDNDPVFKFPGEDAFQPHGPGDQPALGGAGTAATAFMRDAVTPDTPRQGTGAETWNARPDDVRFFGQDYQYEERSALSVPAGGSASLTRVYREGRTLAEAQAGASAAEARLTPPPPPAAPVSAPTAAPAAPAPTTAAAPTPRCVIPKLTRSSLYGTARSKIKKAGCTVGKVRRVRSSVKQGRLVAIRPGGGFTVTPGTKVAIDLSDGKGKKAAAKKKATAKKKAAASKKATTTPKTRTTSRAVARPASAHANARGWRPAR